MTDAEYESLFIQLLDGVNDENWSRGTVKGFLVSKNIIEDDFVGWLRRFGERLLATDGENHQLARRMVLLSKLGCGKLSLVAGEIGRELLLKGEGEEKTEADVWFKRGVEQCFAGDFEKAIASYDKAIEIKPDDYDAWFMRGVALGNLERFEKAIASYHKVIEIKPDDYEVWFNRGIAAGKSISFNQFFAPANAFTIQNPKLNQRGYQGRLASFQEGLKYCQKNTHPEGWGMLHRAIGNAHYSQGVKEANYREYWVEAETEYKKALITLTPENFPELHLKVLRDLIPV